MTLEIWHVAVALTLVFAFINGFHDGCNVIATIVSSRSMRPRTALLWASAAEFVGPLVLGTAVAHTIADSVLRSSLLARATSADLALLVIAATGGAIAWNLITWFVGLPSSSSHALVGGLIGAGLVALGPSAVATDRVLWRVVLPLFVAPVVGSAVGFLVHGLLRGLCSRADRSIRHFFTAAQTPAMLFLAASHGSNDAQKSMGLIGLVLATTRHGHTTAELDLPLWVLLACAAAIALGLSTGGWRIVKTVGYGIFRMLPVHSFSSQVTSTAVVLGASLVGGPVSTTQVVASSVMGVGASKRLAAVRWTAARNIFYAWVLTIPLAAAFAAGCFALLRATFVAGSP